MNYRPGLSRVSSTIEEIASFLKESAAKQCELDPLPTWLVKRASDVLGPVIARICNASFSQTKLPSRSKLAIVRPLLQSAHWTRTTRCHNARSLTLVSFLRSSRRSSMPDSVIMSTNIIYFQSSSRLTAHFIQPKQQLLASLTT